MRKIILALLFVMPTMVSAQKGKILEADIAIRNTTCIDGIVYFVGMGYMGTGLTRSFVSSVKIDPRTLMPQKCS